MDKRVLYRKYRPLDFDSVVGQKYIVKTLINEIKTNSLSHAYIFAGPKGSGKTSIAKIFSKAINCLHPSNFNPCNKCKNCVSINNQSSIEYVELDAASNSGVNEIRNLIESIEYVPSDLKFKIYVIDEAHMLSNSSWNALLKTVEEPPPNVIFIFATTVYNKIPATIVSRSERFDFSRISNHDLFNLIVKICELENIKIESSAIDLIVSLSDGAARDALSILEQMKSFSCNSINVDDINELFGLVNLENKINLINLILNKDIENVISTINNFELHGVNFSSLLFDIIEILMDVYVYFHTKNTSLLKKLTNINLINSINYTDNFLQIIDFFNDNLIRLKNADHQRFLFEYLILCCIENLSKDNTKKVLSNLKTNIELDAGVKSSNMAVDTKNLNHWRKKQSTEPFDGPSIKLSDTSIDIKTDIIEPEPPVLAKNLFVTKEINLSDTSIPSQIKINDEVNQDQSQKEKTSKIVHDATPEVSIKKELPKMVTDEEMKQNFFAVAFNHNNKIKDSHNKKLAELVENSEIEQSAVINRFLKAKKFLITSNNGAFVLMDNITLCNEFNKVSSSKEFYDYYIKEFSIYQKVIAIDKITAKQYLEEYKNLKQQDFKDVKINNNDEEQKITKDLLDILNN